MTNLQNSPLLDKEVENKQNMGSKGLRNSRSPYASKVTGNHYTKGKSCSGNNLDHARNQSYYEKTFSYQQ